MSTGGLERLKEVEVIFGLLVTGLGASMTGWFLGLIVECWKLERGLRNPYNTGFKPWTSVRRPPCQT